MPRPRVVRRIKLDSVRAFSRNRSALHFLHDRGIAHRDLKPENVLCVDRDSPFPVKVCDFDLCSNAVANIQTPKLQTPVGSLEYMAPEVLETFLRREDDYDSGNDTLTYDKKCDLWSLGVILYVMLSGSPPFAGSCGQDCGWDFGEPCSVCQDNLSNSIKSGVVEFKDEKKWEKVSELAKSVVTQLLHKDSAKRIDAKTLLNHPWIVGGVKAHEERADQKATTIIVNDDNDVDDVQNDVKVCVCDDVKSETTNGNDAKSVVTTTVTTNVVTSSKRSVTNVDDLATVNANADIEDDISDAIGVVKSDARKDDSTTRFLRQSSVKELSDFLSTAISLKRALSLNEAETTTTTDEETSSAERRRRQVAISQSSIRLSRERLHRDWEQQTLKFTSIDENPSNESRPFPDSEAPNK